VQRSGQTNDEIESERPVMGIRGGWGEWLEGRADGGKAWGTPRELVKACHRQMLVLAYSGMECLTAQGMGIDAPSWRVFRMLDHFQGLSMIVGGRGWWRPSPSGCAGTVDLNIAGIVRTAERAVAVRSTGAARRLRAESIVFR